MMLFSPFISNVVSLHEAEDVNMKCNNAGNGLQKQPRHGNNSQVTAIISSH